MTAGDVQGGEITIPIEFLPATIQIEEKSLLEITDRTVIARISQTLPAVAETATGTMANNALKNMEVYRAILPRERISKAGLEAIVSAPLGLMVDRFKFKA